MKILIINTEDVNIQEKIRRCLNEFPGTEFRTTKSLLTALNDLSQKNHGFTHIMVNEKVEKLQRLIWEKTKKPVELLGLWSPELIKLLDSQVGLGL